LKIKRIGQSAAKMIKVNLGIEEFYFWIDNLLNHNVHRLSRQGVESSDSKWETPK
jgi:hypothetical protein